MFKITITGPEAGKIQKLADSKHGQILQAVRKAMMDAESLSKKFYLSGPNYTKRGVKNPTPGPDGVLGRGTGRLAGSVKASVQDGNPILGTLSAGPLPYARIHEYGGYAGRNRSARIPKRSYLRPAIMSRMWVLDPLKKTIEEIFRRFK